VREEKEKGKEKEKLELILLTPSTKETPVIPRLLQPINFFVMIGNLGVYDRPPKLELEIEGYSGIMGIINYYKKFQEITWFSEHNLLTIKQQNYGDQSNNWQMLVYRLRTLGIKEAKECSDIIEKYCNMSAEELSKFKEKNEPAVTTIQNTSLSSDQVADRYFLNQIFEKAKKITNKLFFILEYRNSIQSGIHISGSLLNLLGYTPKTFQKRVLRNGFPELIVTRDYYKFWEKPLMDIVGIDYDESFAHEVELIDIDSNLIPAKILKNDKIYGIINGQHCSALFVKFYIDEPKIYESTRNLKRKALTNILPKTSEETKYESLCEQFYDKFYPSEFLESFRPANAKKMCNWKNL
jgi:hypothetical protein